MGIFKRHKGVWKLTHLNGDFVAMETYTGRIFQWLQIM